MSSKNAFASTKYKTSTSRQSQTKRSSVHELTSIPETILHYRLMNIKYKEVKTQNKNDQKIMKYMSDKVIMDKSPHFSIITVQKNGMKNIYLEETHDGTFKHFIGKYSYILHISLLKNMLEQILISILSLHHFGFRKSNFNDIDLNEISYKITKSLNDGSYFHYKFFQKDFFIKDNGFLWIFSTLNELENNYDKEYITTHKYGEEDDFEDEYSRLFEYLLKNQKFPEEFKTTIRNLQNILTGTIKTKDSEETFFKEILKSELLFNQKPSNGDKKLTYIITPTK